MPEIKLIYQQIRELIEQEAKSKAPGEPLPSEVQYSLRYKVSRPTIRKAVDELVDAGIVNRVPGKGLLAGAPFYQPKKGNLLFLVPYIPDDGFFYNMVMGCVSTANTLGFDYRIVNSSSSIDRLAAVQKINLESYSAAIMNAYDNEYDQQLLEYFQAKRFPLVLVDNPLEKFDLPYVITDDYKGGYLAGKHLLERGHKKIIYITKNKNVHTVKTRETGFRKAFEEKGLTPGEEYFIRLNHDNDIIVRLKEFSHEYTAICGYSDLPVIKAFYALAEQGIAVPDDVSLVGYGNFKYSEYLPVPLTTINIPVYEMGCKATEMAAAMINRAKKPEKLMLDVEMIIRSSVSDAENS